MIAIAKADDWIVLKFGGTSVSRRHRWDTIGQLMRERADEEQARVLVVVSALSGVTNALQAIMMAMPYAPAGAARIEALAGATAISAPSCRWTRAAPRGRLARLARAWPPTASPPATGWTGQAEVLAQGELLSSTLGVAYLGSQGLPVEWLDARDWLHAQALAQPERLGAAPVGRPARYQGDAGCARALLAQRAGC